MPRLNLDKCGTESGCITYPADCTAETCIFTISYAATVNSIRFRLLSKQAQSQHSYVGMGISSDQKMNEVSDIAIQSVDGAISCEFTRKLKGNFTYYGHKGLAMLNVDYTASLESEDYHLYLVWGHPYEGSKESVHKHQLLPIVSQSKVAFNKKTRTKFYRLHDSVKVHVTFMVLAWFGAVSVAMVISRYFKNGFLNAKDTICGTKPWFQKELLHAGFGIAVMILTVVQVIMGLVRPDGDAGRKRMAFNWMHLLTGSASYILAAVTMLLGSSFSYMSEKMKSDGTGLLIALISVHVFTAFVFEIRKRCADSFKDAVVMATISLTLVRLIYISESFSVYLAESSSRN
ncbi:FRRS1 [Bugula neritina]|uniref:FRRS1 n=1 Tax=Bugula neritina TaxID=10212 RepID=A0A7J7J460_BUGNE|nr:FRRS1 [Bugula neritina]